MIDWGLALKLAFGGYGSVLVVLITLSVIAWGVSAVVRRLGKKESGR